LLEHVILPVLIEEKGKSGRSELRIWSAGCAAGQEAYSIAMLLDELAHKRGIDISFRIFATDTAEAELETAREGVYDDAAVGNVGLKHINTYFARRGEAYMIAAGLRNRIDFSYYDLLDERTSCPPPSIFGEFDLIMCCNVLYYYRSDIRQCILNKLGQCLARGGYLVTGYAEKGIVEHLESYHPVVVPAAVFQRTDRRR
jgi:chemotaxis protein methyltransferase CheR